MGCFFSVQANSNESKSLMDGTKRSNIQVGAKVAVIQKHHQHSGELTDGIVKRILTKSSTHPHGIKVMLDNGIAGRVRVIK